MTIDGDARARRKAAGREKQEATFERYRAGLQREMMRLASFIALYKKLNEPEPKHERVMRIAPAFFSTVDDALFLSIVVSVDRLLGQPRGDEWNLESFLSFVEANLWLVDPKELQRRRQYGDDHWMMANAIASRVTRETIEADRAELRGLPSLPHFRHRRDTYHAHLDRRYLTDPSKLHADAPLVWGDLRDVLDVPKDILNRYSAAYDGNVYSVTPINIEDVGWLLSLAGDGLTAFQGPG